MGLKELFRTTKKELIAPPLSHGLIIEAVYPSQKQEYKTRRFSLRVAEDLESAARAQHYLDYLNETFEILDKLSRKVASLRVKLAVAQRTPHKEKLSSLRASIQKHEKEYTALLEYCKLNMPPQK